jgi:hypothetical protein
MNKKNFFVLTIVGLGVLTLIFFGVNTGLASQITGTIFAKQPINSQETSLKTSSKEDSSTSNSEPACCAGYSSGKSSCCANGSDNETCCSGSNKSQSNSCSNSANISSNGHSCGKQ